MPIAKCKICKKDFYAKPNWLKQGWGKYCSSICQHKGQLKGKFIKCYICGKETWKQPRQIKHSKSGNFFCSKSCQTIWRNKIVYIGENHPNWKNGQTIYRDILKRSKKEEICSLCKTKDERILAAHHLDGDRKNVRLKNLVWLCHNCHFLVHHYPEIKKKLMAAVV